MTQRQLDPTDSENASVAPAPVADDSSGLSAAGHKPTPDGIDRLAVLDLQWDPTLNALANPDAYHGPTDGQMLEMPGRAALKPVARG
jgi:hypothetical protein